MFPAEAVVLAKDPPAIVYVSEKKTENEGWGFVQFPSLKRLDDGHLFLAVQVAEDSADSYGKGGFLYFISDDKGKTWREIASDERVKYRAYSGVVVEEGVTVSVETPKAPQVEKISLPSKPYTWLPYDFTYSQPTKAYRFEDLPSDLQTLAIRRTDLEEKSFVERAPISLENDLRMVSGDLLPIIFFGPLRKLPGGELLGIFYPSFARSEAGDVDTKSGTLLVSSKDGGHSWQQYDRLPYRPDLQYDPKAYLRGGFTEPAAIITDDGSLLLVLRTADGTPEPFPGLDEYGPLYSVVRSAQGKWSTPTPISPYGVKPSLLKLKNGWLVLSYGRPGIHIRISRDEGKSWSAPFDILPATMSDPRDETCGYCSLVDDPDNPAAFFIAYSRFRHPGADGKLHKAILVQHCYVEGPYPLPIPPEEAANDVDEVIEHDYPGKPGTLAVRISLHRSKPHGPTEGFYQTGHRSFVTPYKHGLIHGLQLFFAPEGYLMKSIPYVGGKRHGVIRLYDLRGNILEEHYYKNGKSCSAKELLVLNV